MSFGGFYKGEKKKPKKQLLEKRAEKSMGSIYTVPQVEIMKRGKREY